MKKAMICLGIFLVLTVVYIFFQYGAISPVSNVAGCYIARMDSFVDKICLHDSGRYEQFYSANGGKEETYNEGSWRSFPYSNDEGDFIAVTLNGFSRVDVGGKVDSSLDLDVQPHKNTFGNVLFSIGSDATRSRRTYVKE